MRLVESGRRVRESDNKPFGFLTDDEFVKFSHEFDTVFSGSRIVNDLIAHSIWKDTGFYFDVSYNKLQSRDLKGVVFDVNDYSSYSELLNAVESKINSDDNGVDNKLVKEFADIISCLYIKDKSIHTWTDRGLKWYTADFIELMYYAKTGKYHDDDSYRKDLYDKYFKDISNSLVSMADAKWIAVPELYMAFRFYQNGRIDVKGLVDKDWERLYNLYDKEQKKGNLYH